MCVVLLSIESGLHCINVQASGCPGLIYTLVYIRCSTHGVKLFVLVMAEFFLQVGPRNLGVD